VLRAISALEYSLGYTVTFCEGLVGYITYPPEAEVVLPTQGEEGSFVCTVLHELGHAVLYDHVQPLLPAYRPWREIVIIEAVQHTLCALELPSDARLGEAQRGWARYGWERSCQLQTVPQIVFAYHKEIMLVETGVLSLLQLQEPA
jgi:hypothetical protein